MSFKHVFDCIFGKDSKPELLSLRLREIKLILKSRALDPEATKGEIQLAVEDALIEVYNCLELLE